MYQDGDLRFALWSPMPRGTHLILEDGKRGVGIVAVRQCEQAPWAMHHVEYLSEYGDILDPYVDGLIHTRDRDFRSSWRLVVGGVGRLEEFQPPAALANRARTPKST